METWHEWILVYLLVTTCLFAYVIKTERRCSDIRIGEFLILMFWSYFPLSAALLILNFFLDYVEMKMREIKNAANPFFNKVILKKKVDNQADVN